MRIKAFWDSGAYGFYYPAPDNMTDDVFEVDEAIYKRYVEAEEARNAAEDDMQQAYYKQRKAQS